jgi:ubiquinone/menaquinone biosynthesis C-methylase UbiE
VSDIDTYKHVWRSCNDCGNVFRERKGTYLIKRLPVAIQRRIPRLGYFLADPAITGSDGSAIYDYMSTYEAPDATKYATEFVDFRRDVLDRFGIDVSAKTVLDVSGGPGFLAKQLGGVAKKVVMTEFNQPTVDFARERLGIPAFRFDFNADDISRLTDDVYDVVLIRYAINFCTDIPRFLASLKRLLHRDSVIFISYVMPSLGVCLRWQLDDYTYPVLYNPETMARLFAEAGFVATRRHEDGAYDYRWNRSLAQRLVAWPYRVKADKRFINGELIQKNMAMLFQFRPASTPSAQERAGTAN